MKKEEKEKLQAMLGDLVESHERAWKTLEDDDDFWDARNRMKEFLDSVQEGAAEPAVKRVAREIEWDTDGDADTELPGEVEIPDNVSDEDISDYLSDRYGYLVYSYREDRSDRCVRMNTPAGPIEARLSCDSEYPGIYLVYAEEGSGEPGALMEYVPEGAIGYPGHVVLRIWNREEPDEGPWMTLPMSKSKEEG